MIESTPNILVLHLMIESTPTVNTNNIVLHLMIVSIPTVNTNNIVLHSMNREHQTETQQFCSSFNDSSTPNSKHNNFVLHSMIHQHQTILISHLRLCKIAPPLKNKLV